MTTNTQIAAHMLLVQNLASVIKQGLPWEDAYSAVEKSAQALEAAELGQQGEARIWIDQSETSPTQVVGKLLRTIPDELLVTAERDNEDDDWYIRVTNSGGYKDYNGYWRASARKSADEVMIEAARGAMVPLASAPPPAPALDAQGETAALPFAILDDELKALHRFHECATDGEGYDVRPPMMKRLAEIGLLRRVHGNRYEHTNFGLSVLNGDFAISATPSPQAPLESKPPLSDEQIEAATGAKRGTPLFLVAVGFSRAIELAHGIGVKEATNG